MSVDFDAIAQHGRCDASSLRHALPLLEQGYTPPFLARYRSDELNGLDEASLWALSAAAKAERQLDSRREELRKVWERTTLRDPALAYALADPRTIVSDDYVAAALGPHLHGGLFAVTVIVFASVGGVQAIVTGATGFVGGAVLDHLVSAGHQVTATVRSEASAATVRERGGRPVEATVGHPDSLLRAFDGHDV